MPQFRDADSRILLYGEDETAERQVKVVHGASRSRDRKGAGGTGAVASALPAFAHDIPILFESVRVCRIGVGDGDRGGRSSVAHAAEELLEVGAVVERLETGFGLHALEAAETFLQCLAQQRHRLFGIALTRGYHGQTVERVG